MSEKDVPVRTERHGRVLLITLHRPHARNAVNPALAASLESAVDDLEHDEDLWAGVLTGEGPVFCAGADLNTVAGGNFPELLTHRGGFAGFVRRERSKPIVAALDGDALAGGMELAIACDLIIAAEGVRLGIPETARSLLAIGGGLANLPRLIGEKAALELALTAAPWPAERLATLGLISRTLPVGTARDAALDLATEICGNAPLAVRGARRAILAGRDHTEDERWALAERELAALEGTQDYHEGPRSFVAKRAPRWTGR